MNILFIINYYYPYVSGGSEYFRILAEKLVEQGYHVVVLTDNHANLKFTEVINGVEVIRAKILGKIGKGTVSFDFIRLARKMCKRADIIQLSLPMLESGLIAQFVPRNKLILTHHCNVNLPKSVMNDFIILAMNISQKMAMKRCSKIGVATIDYAMHSKIVSEFPQKMIEIAPPIKEYTKEKLSVSKKAGDNIPKVIGFCGRIVEEKGIDVLLKAYHILKREYGNNIKLKIAGDYESIAGGSIYPILKKYIEENQIKDVKFLGKVPEEEMMNFYRSLDVFTLPSTNSLESFGMVQLEAMMCGTPVVASDLYGVRTIVGNTGMGLVVKAGDEQELAYALKEVIYNREKYVKSKDDIQKKYGTEITVQKYIQCYNEMIHS